MANLGISSWCDTRFFHAMCLLIYTFAQQALGHLRHWGRHTSGSGSAVPCLAITHLISNRYTLLPAARVWMSQRLDSAWFPNFGNILYLCPDSYLVKRASSLTTSHPPKAKALPGTMTKRQQDGIHTSWIPFSSWSILACMRP